MYIVKLTLLDFVVNDYSEQAAKIEVTPLIGDSRAPLVNTLAKGYTLTVDAPVAHCDNEAEVQRAEWPAAARSLPAKIIDIEQDNVQRTRFFGIPITELDRDSLLVCAAIGAKGMNEAFQRFRDYMRFEQEIHSHIAADLGK